MKTRWQNFIAWCKSKNLTTHTIGTAIVGFAIAYDSSPQLRASSLCLIWIDTNDSLFSDEKFGPVPRRTARIHNTAIMTKNAVIDSRIVPVLKGMNQHIEVMSCRAGLYK